MQPQSSCVKFSDFQIMRTENRLSGCVMGSPGFFFSLAGWKLCWLIWKVGITRTCERVVWSELKNPITHEGALDDAPALRSNCEWKVISFDTSNTTIGKQNQLHAGNEKKMQNRFPPESNLFFIFGDAIKEITDSVLQSSSIHISCLRNVVR